MLKENPELEYFSLKYVTLLNSLKESEQQEDIFLRKYKDYVKEYNVVKQRQF